MMFGNPSEFAIECEIDQAFRNPGQFALGFFVLYLNEVCYGVRSTSATLLACSFDEVTRRAEFQGHRHIDMDRLPANEVATIVHSAIYADVQASELRFGHSLEDWRSSLYQNNILWAPDGDEAFGDGSIVIQCDLGETVRIVGFKNRGVSEGNITEIEEVLMPGERFYHLLRDSRDAIEAMRNELLLAEPQTEYLST